MTHPSGLIREAVELGAAGRTPADIARLLDVHRSTVRCWLDGRTPSRWRPDPEATCPTCEGGAHAFSELPPVYVHLLGLYLGDGCLSAHPRGVFKLRIVLDTAYPQIIAECEQSIRAVAPDGSIRRCAKQGCAEVFSYSKAWVCLFPQHGPGRKHERRIVLADWQRDHVEREPKLLLRGLIQSDGCRFINTGRGGWRHPRYTFCNVSDDIRGIFCNACDLAGVRYTHAPPKTVYVSRKADVAFLDTFIGPKA